MIDDKFIEHLKHSRHLSLSSKNLTGEDIKKITSTITKKSSLYAIYLNENSIKDDGVVILTEMIAKSKKTLNSLHLTENNITSKGIKYLLKSLENSKLMFLDLSDNNIGDEGLMYISDTIKYTKIKKLTLKNIQITSKGIKYFSETIKDSNISHLNIDGNEIDDEGIKYLVDAIENSKIHEFKLSLKNTKFRSLGFLYLENIIKKLSFLDISGNYFDYNTIQRLLKTGIQYKGCYLSFNVFNDEENSISVKILEVKIVNRIILTNIKIDLISEKIDTKLSILLNENLRKYKVVEINIKLKTLSKQYIKNLRNMFNGVKICKLNIHSDIMSNQPELFAEIFEDCEIYCINFSTDLMISLAGLGIFLEKVKIYNLNLDKNTICGELQDFLPSIENPLFSLSLKLNKITNESVEILKEFLLQSSIRFFDLIVNSLNENVEQRIFDQLKDIKFTKVSLNKFPLPYNEDLDKTISQTFEDFTYFNDSSDKYEFKVPQKKCSTDDFFNFIKILKQNTKSKISLYPVFYNFPLYPSDYEIEKFYKARKQVLKINEFVETLSNEFFIFFNQNLTKMDEIFDDFNFLIFLKICGNGFRMDEATIVKNLLIQRRNFIENILKTNSWIPSLCEFLEFLKE